MFSVYSLPSSGKDRERPAASQKTPVQDSSGSLQQSDCFMFRSACLRLSGAGSPVTRHAMDAATVCAHDLRREKVAGITWTALRGLDSCCAGPASAGQQRKHAAHVFMCSSARLRLQRELKRRRGCGHHGPWKALGYTDTIGPPSSKASKVSPSKESRRHRDLLALERLCLL